MKTTVEGDRFIIDNPSPKHKIHELPERRAAGYRRWSCPKTDVTAEWIWKWHEDTMMSVEAEMEVKLIRARLAALDTCAERVAQFKATGVVNANYDLTMSEDLPLRPFQQVGALNILSTDSYSLFMEQGLGKSAIVVTAICNLAQMSNKPYRAVIVCPRNLQSNWVNEINKFSTVDFHVVALRKSKLKRIESLVQSNLAIRRGAPGSIVVVKYGTVMSDWEILQAFNWDMAVVDESHYIKSPSAKRSQYVMKLRDTAKRRVALTGTPIERYPDLYNQLEFTAEGASGFSSHKKFRSFYGVFSESNGDSMSRLVGMQNLPLMKSRLARYTYIVKKAEVLKDLPKKWYDIVDVEMTPAQEKVYAQVAEDLLHELEQESEQESNKALEINNVLVRMLKLSQITSGFIKYSDVRDDDGLIVEKGEIEKIGTRNAKVEELWELLKDKKPESKTIVWAIYVWDIQQISQMLTERGIKHVTYYGGIKNDSDRAAAVQAFNEDDSTKVFVGNPVAASVGLTLLGYPIGKPELSECNCDHVIYYSQGWSSNTRMQSEDRPHRIGTRCQLRITDLCVPGTIDETIRERVLEKQTAALAIQDLRNVLKGFLDENN